MTLRKLIAWLTPAYWRMWRMKYKQSVGELVEPKGTDDPVDTGEEVIVIKRRVT